MEDYTWQYIQKHPRETKRLLGIEHEQLIQLIERGKILHKIQQEKIEKNKIRIIKAGGGNHPKLSEEEQIILMLVYLRHNLSFQLLSLLFHVREASAHKFFDYWQKLFQDDLPPSLLEQVKKCSEEMEKIRENLTKYELIVDSAEHEIQKKYYSGKQKRHRFKNQLVVLPKGADIVDVVVSKPSPMSDIKICRQIFHKFDSQQAFSGDKAYVGESQITTPQKKPKNGQLTEEQKEENKLLSSRRIFVEYLIRVVKIFKVIQERFRLQKRRYN